MLRHAFLLLFSIPLFGAITNGHVVRVASTQIEIAYTAPSDAACTVEVSEESDYSPLSHDVDPVMFPNSDEDITRYPKLQSGRARNFVIGTRRIDRALDGQPRSRALANATLHYIRVTCGMDTAEITATTATLPFGDTYVDPPQPHDLYDGEIMTLNYSTMMRGDHFIDPSTGTKMYRISNSQDLSFLVNNSNTSFMAVGQSTNWTNPNNILAADASNATYDGANCSATCDWIVLHHQAFGATAHVIDYIKPEFIGSGNQANAADRQIEWGLGFAIEGSCAESVLDGETRMLTLPQTTPTTVEAAIDYSFLIPPTALRPWTRQDVINAGGFCVFIRKATATGTISIDHARWDGGVSQSQSLGSGAMYRRGSDLKDENGFLMTDTQTGGGRAVLYKVKMNEGTNLAPEIRYLGQIQNLGGVCVWIGYSSLSPNRFYCNPSSSQRILQIDYTGNSANKAAPYTLEISATELTANMTTDIKNFVDAHIEHYPFAFDNTKFNCQFNTVVQLHGEDEVLQIMCRRGQQDSYAWAAVYQVGTGIVAAYPMWSHKTSRWCGHHAHEEIGQYGGLYLWTSHFLGGSGTGNGPYRTTLNGAINNSQTTITLAGQPTSITADTSLMDFAVNDTVVIDSEWIRITNIDNFPTIGVQRGVAGSSAASHSNGVNVMAMCASDPDGQFYQVQASMHLWDPFADPYGDGNGISNKLYRGHETIRPALGINTNDFSYDQLTVGQDFAYPYSIYRQPPFASRVSPAAGNSYQSHPSVHAVAADLFGRRVAADTKALVGGNLFSGPFAGCNPALLLPTPGGCPAQRVSGTDNTYKYTFSGAVRSQAPISAPNLWYRQMPVYAVSGFLNLKNISGPGSAISDATPYTFCIALVSDECRSGSSPGDMYLSAPGVVSYGCTGGEIFTGGFDLCITERVASTLSATEIDANVPGVNMYSVRDLVDVSSLAQTTRFSSGAVVEHIADGSGLMIVNRAPRNREDVFIAKVPPYNGAVDSANRQTFRRVPITIKNVPSGATRLLVEFGYDTSFTCSPNRAEACYAVGSTVNETTPFLWQTELTSSSGLDISGGCSSGCTVAIPALHNRVGFYRLIYRDGSGGTVFASPVETF